MLSGHTNTTMNGSVTNATDITISAIADNTAIANSFVFGLSIIGLNGGAGFATLDTGSDIKASVGSTASLGGSGAIKVEAKTRNDGNKADAKAEGGALGVLFSGVVFIAVATIKSTVEAHMDGDVTRARRSS